MMDAADLTDFIFKAALAGCGADVKRHKAALWDVAITILADVLRNSDQLGRERLLRVVPATRSDNGLRQGEGHKVVHSHCWPTGAAAALPYA